MAKRFQPMKNFAGAKKPKLDFGISRGHSDFGSSSRKSATVVPQPARTSSAIPNAIDFWDDDDDDVILMATQQAEAAAVRQSDVVIAETEMTFSEFAPRVHGTTSTQQLFPPPAPKPKPTKNDIAAMFGDDDDFDFLVVAAAEKHAIIEEPPLPAPSPTLATVTSNAPAATVELQVLTQTTSTLSQTTAARRQLAQERQMKFLMERADVLKKEVSKLQSDLRESKERLETKDGEASLLRDELLHLRHQLQASKLDKLKIAETAKMDCNSKVAEVVKLMTAKETELKLKDVEFSKLKQRHSISTRNFEMSMCADDHNASVHVVNQTERRNLLRLQNLTIDSAPNKHITNNSTIYDYIIDGGKSNKRQRTLFQVELEQLFLNYAQLQSPNEAIETITTRILASVDKVFTQFRSYACRLEFPQNCSLYACHSYTLQLDTSADRRQSLCQPTALFGSERAISLRRYIATLALLCQQNGQIALALLQHKLGEDWLLALATDAIVKIGYSNEVCQHFGVLEATSALLLSLLSHAATANAKPQLHLLYELLKQLVFTRPSPWILGKLSACMVACTRQPALLACMCVNSDKDSFVSDRVHSLHRFGPDSCLLQVYAGLLERAFFSDVPLQPAHYELLLAIAGQHVRFVYQCFVNPPDFLLEMLPCFADDEEEPSSEASSKLLSSCSITAAGSTTAANSSSLSSASTAAPVQASQTRSCECYVKLCLSVVTLVFQMLQQWTLQRSTAATAQVGEVSQVAVHLLTLIFREYYLNCLFRESEETTKHYLSFICNCWTQNAKLLQFQDIHTRLLSHLQNSHFMLKPLHQEANPSNPTNDLAEWTRIVQNADAEVAKYESPSDALSLYPLSMEHNSKFFDGLKRLEYNFE